MGERKFMQSTDMKYQLNKIFPILIKWEENDGKSHFNRDLGLLGPTFESLIFLEVSALLDVRHCPKLQSCVISSKTDDANLRKWRKT